jgi:histidine triad (HIT) family protein
VYDISDNVLAKIHVFSKQLALAMKELYSCDGVSIRQHNEPAGYQEVWHYHLHVIPRYIDDNLYPNYPNKVRSDDTIRAEYAKKLRDYFSKNN